jgi:quercetin dioxygenase-like cupin family protein
MEGWGLGPVPKIVVIMLVPAVGLVLGALGTQGALGADQDDGGGTVLQAQSPMTRAVLMKSEKLTGIPGMDAYVMDVTVAPGAQTGWHVHPGHEFGYILDGEGGTLEVQGQPTAQLKNGMAYHVDAMVPHNGTNTSKTVPARYVVLFVVESGKPVQTSVPAPAQ